MYQGRVQCPSEGGRRLRRAPACAAQFYHTAIVYQVLWQKSIPAQIRQLFLHVNKCKKQVDEFVPESTFAKRLKSFVCDKLVM